MHLFLLGVSHRTAPVELRERLDFSSRDLGAAVEALAPAPSAAESVVLSTCNRSEIYVASSDPAQARDELVQLPERVPPAAAARRSCRTCSRYDDADAAGHLFRVAAGLDSLVVGEPQILGQVKDAFQAAAERRCTGPLLEQAVPLVVRRRQARAHRDGARRGRGLGQLRGGGAGAQDLRPARRPPRAGRRRRRDQHADGAAPARRRVSARSSSPAGRRRTPRRWPATVGGRAVPWDRPGARPRRRRHRHHRDRLAAADHHARAGRSGDRPAPARSAVHHRHRRAARRRAGGRRHRTGVPLQRRRPADDRPGEPVAARRRDRRRPRRSSARRWRASAPWQRSRGAIPTIVALRQRFDAIRARRAAAARGQARRRCRRTRARASTKSRG